MAPGVVVEAVGTVVFVALGVVVVGVPVGMVVETGEQGARVQPFVDWDHLEYLRLVGGLGGVILTLTHHLLPGAAGAEPDAAAEEK